MSDNKFGLKSTGFVLKRLPDIKTSIEDALRAEFGAVNLSPGSVFSQIVGSVSPQLADLWELAEAVYKARFASSAEGISLDDVAENVGLVRLKATKTRTLVALFGDQGTVVPAATEFSVSSTKSRFVTETARTIDIAAFVVIDLSITTVANNTVYSVTIGTTLISINSGDSATATTIASALATAISASSVAVTATSSAGTLRVFSDDYLQTFALTANTANITLTNRASPVYAQAKETGPVVSLAGTLTVIETPAVGLSSINNFIDGVQGRNEETDVAFRLRRKASLRIAGAGAVEAIRARLQNTLNVSAAFVFENPTGLADAAGRPPHSLEAIVSGGTNLDVATTIWNAKPAGIELFGNTTQVILDSQGNNQTIKFSRAVDVYVWLTVVLTLHAEEIFPSNGLTQVRDALLTYGASLQIGNDVLLQRLYGPVHTVPGVKSAVITIATSTTPAGPPGAYTAADLAVAAFNIAKFDSSRITVS